MTMQFPLLEVLDDAARRELISRARRRRFARHEVVFHEGDPGDALHLVVLGHVAVRVHTPLGDVATVRILRPGQCFGELAVISPAPRSGTAVALDPVETLSLDRTLFEDLRTRHPEVDLVIREVLVTMARSLTVQLVDAMYVPAEQRVWRRLLELADVFGTAEAPATVVPITQEVVAQLAGCTRPTANQILRSGEDAGLIRMERGRIEFLDLAMIERRAST
ncbi:MAG TPA: Crp/Fnr family transcriptional regulator [Acidimicrobiia bacterium]|nr:Crp/Fnr family transcriptional regulator [Acidimicrobiia bacterium]